MGAKKDLFSLKRDTSTAWSKERVGDYKENILAVCWWKSWIIRLLDAWIVAFPFCLAGCPLGNEFRNSMMAVYNQSWKKQSPYFEHQYFPEFNRKNCPAPCWSKLCIGINKDPVGYRTWFEKKYCWKPMNLVLIKAKTLRKDQNRKSIAVSDQTMQD